MSSPERLAEILRICGEALAHEGAARTAYLDTACRGDAALRGEVEALFHVPVSGDGFLDTPPWAAPALAVGQRLGPYEVLGRLGAGGMGQVYEARDSRLGRTVAIKVLPPGLAADSARRARLEQEARAVSSLSHPHICVLHDVGEHEGAMFLVMERLSGETLAARLQRGALSLHQALTTATEIADALAAAHRQGVVHRDLKPGNVMLTKSGAKLLDFGLAKSGVPPPSASGVPSSPPVRASSITGEGTIVGTLAYLSPEQLEGRDADTRSDLFAFGALLYEMLSGRRAFEGDSQAALITAIRCVEPPRVSTLQPLTPPLLDRLVRRCLAKSPDDRPDSARDVADELRWMQETNGDRESDGVGTGRRRFLRHALMAAGAASLLAAGAGLTWLLRPSAPLASLRRPSLDVRPAEELNGGASSPFFMPTPGGSRTALAWAPDGRALVFVGVRVGVRQLYVRSIAAGEARLLQNTEGAQEPAVSADGQWVAFWANRAIRKVAFEGGPVTELVRDVEIAPYGLAWDGRGRLFFGRWDDDRIWMVPPEGEPVPVTSLAETDLSHRMPSPLPGGRGLLYTVRKRALTWGAEEIVAQVLPAGRRKTMLLDAADARYVATGHLVFMRRGTLFAVAFDPERLEVRGAPVAVLDTVAQALTAASGYDISGAGQFALAATGALAWVPGPMVPYPVTKLVAVDRRGRVSELPAPSHHYVRTVRLSPDGRRLLVNVQTLTDFAIYVYDLERGTLSLRWSDAQPGSAIWSPNGSGIFFSWLKDGRFWLAAQPGEGAPQALAPGGMVPSSLTRDGRHLAAARLMERSGADTGSDIVIATADSDDWHVQPFTATPQLHEGWPDFSPDGRWLVFGSNESGRNEVYVRPYPDPGRPVPVSVDGGDNPAWNPNGREVFFVSLPGQAGRRRMMAADFAPGSPPRLGRPRSLFEFDHRELRLAGSMVRNYDVSGDGQRFYTILWPAPPTPPRVTHVNLIGNWLEELKAKLQRTR